MEINYMEMNTTPARSDSSVLIKMEAAINAHDIDTFVTCFANDFVSEQPVHPDRDFTGVEHVRKNWTDLFAQVPDLRAKLVAHTIAGDIGWSEWHWQGKRTNGTELNMRGVVVVGLRENTIVWARLYMEPVQSLPK
jgi:ketosteroid isomerase-like protein